MNGNIEVEVWRTHAAFASSQLQILLSHPHADERQAHQALVLAEQALAKAKRELRRTEKEPEADLALFSSGPIVSRRRPRLSSEGEGE